MIKGNWKLNHGILSIVSDQLDPCIPSASEIINLLEGEIGKIYSKNKEFYVNSLPENIDFSDIPVDLTLKIDSVIRNGFLNIFINLVLKKVGLDYSLPEFLNWIPDHIVLDKCWYPFRSGSFEEIKVKLTELGITRTESISLNQYLTLRNEKDLVIEDISENWISAENITETIKDLDDSILLRNRLYDYQKRGVKWLLFMESQRIGCILADEMGLGKTIQAIALILRDGMRELPSLIVAPATVMENWRRELIKFAPTLNSLLHSGSNRSGDPRKIKDFDVVICSYDTALRDEIILKSIHWGIIVLDEAQAIKNPEAQRSGALKKLKSDFCIAITGTPVQNSMLDLWSILDFCVPGHLGSKEEFESRYENDTSYAKKLEPYVSPFILRREIRDVALELPEKIDIPQALYLEKSLAVEYEKLREDAIKESGALACLVKLRQFCCHPNILAENLLHHDPAENNNKYQRLIEILEEIIANNNKCIIFTSFTRMIDLLASDLFRRFTTGIWQLDGRTLISTRQNLIDEFNNHRGSGILIMNPAAGGVGINVTGANNVIHYNSEWNPAVVDQATARAYRKGQKLPVTVHRLYYINTVEEIIEARLMQKREIFESVIIKTDEKNDKKDILLALQKSPLLSTEPVD